MSGGGTKLYCLPGSDVECEVDYEIQDGAVIFLGASIDGQQIDCRNHYIKRQVKMRRNHLTYTGEEMIRLRQHFQERLDLDEEDILNTYCDAIAEQRADERAGR